MVSIAERMHGGITGCEFRIGSAIALPFDANSFDLCVGDAFLHHVLETDECLVEVARVLRPGGIATFNEPNAHGYAFFEFVLSSLDSSCEFRDDAIDSYLHCLRFMREHQGDRAALEAYPLPDKHVFSEEGIREAAMKAGFTGSSCVPAMDSYPTLWLDAFQYVLDAIHVSPLVREKVVEAARQLDLIMGEEARKHFCLHNQFFLYK
jgi:ubiquinone/menaquinone biosynthesis C-methylase UbiE